MKNRSLLLMLVAGLSLLVSVASAYERDPVTFGAVVRLRHKLTGLYLTGTDERYSHIHEGSSGQPAVFCGTDGNAHAAHWIVKGPHTGDRWSFNISARADPKWNSMMGWPVRHGQRIRFENRASYRNLHAHNAPSPYSNKHGQKEVTTLGSNGVCNTDDDFWVTAVEDGTGGYINNGSAAKFRHCNTNWVLHSHAGWWWQTDKQEVTIFSGFDDNDWFVVEIIEQPDKNGIANQPFSASRGPKIQYWTPLFWDSENEGLGQKVAKRRLWAHGGSPWDDHGNAVPPHDHLELLSGPWDDERARQGASIFLLEHADEKFKTGPVKFGDRVKILATGGGRGEDDKSGILKPFRYLWTHEFSRHGRPWKDIVISRPEHSGTQGANAIFIIEPIIAGQSGEISTNDLFRLRSVATGDYMWMNIDSRHSDPRGGHTRWLEPLLTKGTEDDWALRHLGYYRNYVTEKFRFSLATNDSAADGAAQGALATVNGEIELILGAEAAKQKAAAEAARNKQLEQEKADLAAKVAAEQAEAARLKASTAQQMEDFKKAAADELAKAQADAAAILAKAKADDAVEMAKAKAEGDALLAAAKKAAADTQKSLEDQLAKERAQAREMMQQAKDAIEDAKKEAEDLAKQKISEVEAKAQAEAQLAAVQAEELKRMLNLPIGFVKIPGKVKSVSFGLQDREIEKTVDNKGTKEKMLTFDDFGVVVLEDGSIAQYLLTTDPANPWQHVPLVDDKGAELKVASAAVGLDGTTYVISKDGKSLYGISWPGDTPAAMPQASKGFEAADAKKANREKQAKRLGARKKHKGKGGKHAKGKKQGVAAAGRGKSHVAKAKKHEAKPAAEGKAKQHEGGKKKHPEKKNVEKKGAEKKKNNKKLAATPSEAPTADQGAATPAGH